MSNNHTQLYSHAIPNAERRDVANLMAELQRERSRRIQAESQVTVLQKEIAGRDRTSKIVLQAIRDAAELLLRKTTGYSIARDAMGKEGMSARRWTWAIALLRYSIILSTRSRKFILRWNETDPNELFAMFETATNRLMQAEKPLDSLRQCLPTSRRPVPPTGK